MITIFELSRDVLSAHAAELGADTAHADVAEIVTRHMSERGLTGEDICAGGSVDSRVQRIVSEVRANLHHAGLGHVGDSVGEGR